ncbi:MAG: TIGR01777 family protein [Myxococcales bacterium]|nr:TIGR01777 family protein [Myxococcales bacterium]MCB9644935.1 TIGR01777 family protein [Myxococcales bacterium]
MAVFTKRTKFASSAHEVFAWHRRDGAFERLSPPWDRVEIVEKQGGIEEGARMVMRLHLGPIPQTWEAVHQDYIEDQLFTDVQKRGPFASWEHEHRFLSQADGGCVLEDHIHYELPMGALGRAIGGGSIQRTIQRMFAFRHQRLAHDLMRHRPYLDRPRLRVAISGASGLLGTALSAFLTTGGHEVVPLVRNKQAAATGKGIYWSPRSGEIDQEALEGFDVVVHLAGENIAGRWTASKRKRILESREQSTQLLANALAKLTKPPKALLSASGINTYGDRGDEILTEESALGTGFLTDVCQAWEDGTQAAEDAGIRVAKMRIGAVITSAGGALAQMLLPFKMGVGGIVGSGHQYMSWIGLDDLLGAILHLMYQEKLSGVFNMVSPEPANNRDFTKALGKALHRPTIFPLPAFMINAIFGEMGKALLLDSVRAVPQRLLDSGFTFSAPAILDVLRSEVGDFDEESLLRGVAFA